jgi:uncharacterized protein YutE (UPF0331/DUF86 family)
MTGPPEGLPLDWRTFIANIIDSLAWPAVVLFLVLLLRNQLAGLISRLLSLKWGGVEVSFKEILEEAREITEEIREEAPPKVAPPQPEDDTLMHLARTHPRLAVLDAYSLIEQVIKANADKLPHRKGTKTYMSLLRRKGLLNDDAYLLFDKLRQIRNAVVHGYPSITEDEAAEYVGQARFLRNLLAERFAKRK